MTACFESYGASYTFSENEKAVRAVTGDNPTPQQINELICSKFDVPNFNFTDPSAFKFASSSYNLATSECFVNFAVLKPVGSLKPGDVYKAKIFLQTRKISPQPLTDSQLQRIIEPIAQQNPEAVLHDANLSDSDWSSPKVHVLPGTLVNSQPFTDPSDNKAKQARWQFYDCGQNESCVKETLIDRPDLQPNSPAAPLPNTPPAPGTGGGTAPGTGNQTGNDQPPPFDLCKEHPEILACQQMGQPDPSQFDDIKIPVRVDDTTWTEDIFLPSTGTCPAPKTFHVMGRPVEVSYQPLCSFMESIRFAVLICFILSAAYISFGALKQG